MLDLLLSRRCAVCGRALATVCCRCASSWTPAPDLGVPPGLATCRSLLVHDGSGRETVLALKYRGRTDVARAVAPWLARLAAVADGPAAEAQVVTWAPTARARARARGYDQAELLAREVARHLDVVARPLLRRDGTAHQTGRPRAERMDAPTFTIAAAPPLRLLLVDDVRTTGATLCAAADALLLAGADEVHGLTLAVRP